MSFSTPHTPTEAQWFTSCQGGACRFSARPDGCVELVLPPAGRYQPRTRMKTPGGGAQVWAPATFSVMKEKEAAPGAVGVWHHGFVGFLPLQV